MPGAPTPSRWGIGNGTLALGVRNWVRGTGEGWRGWGMTGHIIGQPAHETMHDRTYDGAARCREHVSTRGRAHYLHGLYTAAYHWNWATATHPRSFWLSCEHIYITS